MTWTRFVIPHQNGGGLTKFGELPCTLPALVVTGVGWVSWAIVRVDSRTNSNEIRLSTLSSFYREKLNIMWMDGFKPFLLMTGTLELPLLVREAFIKKKTTKHMENSIY